MRSTFPLTILALVAIENCISACARAQSPQFVEEVIEVRVHGSYCTFVGTYTFKNHETTNAAWRIFYPLPNTNELPFPDSLDVRNEGSEDSVLFEKSDNGISFLVQAPLLAVSTYRVFYRQRTPARKMEYILTTTKQWARPLKRSTFVIIVPDSLRLAGISIPFDSVQKRSHERVYRIQKKDYMPKKNLIFHWKRRTQ